MMQNNFLLQLDDEDLILTRRQIEIVQLYANNHCVGRIALLLGIKAQSIRNHFYHAMNRAGFGDNGLDKKHFYHKLVVWAWELGLII